MLKRTKLSTSLLMAFGGALAVVGAHAQTQEPQKLERVEVTGSAIKRIDAETAVPISVIKMDDLKKEGVTTIEQVVQRLSSSQSSQGTSQSVGLGTGGASFANMRGLGQNKTLILLNGRRVANNAIDGSAPDLNMIPFAALERVEVLRDGASALYGTDAIGGVINFITRKSFTGGTVSLGADVPQHSGGKSGNANVGYGFGDLDKDGFNILGVLDFQKQKELKATQRPFGSTGNIPDKGIARSSASADPGNYSQGAHVGNPAGPDCTSNAYIFSAGNGTCRYDFAKWVDLLPEDERVSGLLRGTKQITPDSQFSLEYFGTHLKNTTVIAPVPYAALTMDAGTKYYPGMGITPADPLLNPTAPIRIRWRDVPNGPRTGEDDNTQHRLVAAFEGAAAGWDYSTGLSYNQNKVVSKLPSGYSDGPSITAGVKTGVINPFGPQDAAGNAAIQAAGLSGTLFTAKGEVWSLDGKASREVGDWLGAGRQAALAVGAEARHEKFTDKANSGFAQQVIASTGFDPNTDTEGTRSVTALFSELNVPVIKSLELTAALRYDRYSDFGNTTNPKLGFRFQPSQEWLLRGSASTGFRAPSLYEINAPITYTNTANAWNDPVRCPGGVPIPGAAAIDVCNTQFIVQNGGNHNLQPEKSKNATIGFVFEPIADANIGLDFWWIKLKHSINVLPDTLIFANPTKYASLFHRAPDGSLSTDGSQCPGPNCGYITDTTSNLGGVNTDGVDLTASYRLRAGDVGTFNFGIVGTYIDKYEYQQEDGGVWNQNAGIYSGTGPIFRWQHTLTAQWTRGQWTAGVANRYKSGYFDQNDVNQLTDPSFANNHVGAYSLWDIFGTWMPNKQLALTAGVKNLFDKDPPFSNQGATFQVGYDPRFTDPQGRTFYVRGTYNF